MKKFNHFAIMVLSCILAAICFVGCDEQNSHLHSFDSWTVLKEATCTESGEKEGVCACGEKMTQQIPALGHSYDETIDKEATCLEVGSKTCVCTRCGDEKTEVIRALGHSYELTDSKNATCTEAGSKTYVCQRCGEERTEEIPARGHYWIPATCTKEKYCSRCQATEGSPLGHNYSNGKCTRCGKEKVGEVVVLNTMPMTLHSYGTTFVITDVRSYYSTYKGGFLVITVIGKKTYDKNGQFSTLQCGFSVIVYSDENKSRIISSESGLGPYVVQEQSFTYQFIIDGVSKDTDCYLLFGDDA